MSYVWRSFVVLVLLVPIAAACGDDDTTSAPGETPTVAASGDTGGSSAGAGTTEPTATEGSTGSSGAGETYATVSVGGETFEFFMDGNAGICNPDLLGVFQVSLYQEGNPEGVAGLQLSIRPDDKGGLPESLLRVGQVWIADAGYTPGSYVESAGIDGNHLEGTAMFADADGNLDIPGTFEVTCVS